MSTPREFYLADIDKYDKTIFTPKDVAEFRKGFNDNGEYIHVIEKTPEVVRKLECFDEVGFALVYAFNRMVVNHLRGCMQYIDGDNDCTCGEAKQFNDFKELMEKFRPEPPVKAKGE